VEVLEADGMPDALLGEQPAAATLRAERGDAGIRTVHRHVQCQRYVAFQRCGVVRNEVRAGPVGDEIADLA
jgi:hypothetical protein